MNTMELLAPAGSMETLRAVCAAGADAVYVGGGQFGARAYAKNFTQEELLQAIDELHLQGKKLHLTVNTLLKTQELEEQLYDYLLPYYEQGLDAVIVQDVGVFDFIRKQFPGMELHASTQMSVAAADGAHFWSQAGADRVVLARELSLQEIRHIHETVDVPLECFVHGAICYCYSGQCLFSSMLGGRSGNRGRCAQPCRLPYRVQEQGQSADKGRELYPLSPKDLCAIDLLPELAMAGVCSLKIEGRMKQTAYAAGVTAVYRKYLDLLATGEDYAVAESDRRQLLDLGNRSGFTAGYLRGEKGKSMISLYSPKHTSTEPGEQPQRTALQRMIRGYCECHMGAPVTLTITDPASGLTVCAKAGEIQPAKNAPAVLSDIERVLQQTGDTGFAFEQLEIHLDDHCFIPKQFLKAVRRDALEALHGRLSGSWRRQTPVQRVEDIRTDHSLRSTEGCTQMDGQALVAVCDTWEQLEICVQQDYIYTVAIQLQSIGQADFVTLLQQTGELCLQQHKHLLLAMPSVFRAESVRYYEKQWTQIKNCVEIMQEHNLFAGFLAKTYDILGFLQRMGVPQQQIWLDSPLYTFSDRAVSFFKEKGYRYRTLPLELTAGELRRQPQDGSCLIIYGHAPFMVSSQCVNRTMHGCDRTEKTMFLTDRYGKHLPVRNYCSVCCNVIYNALPTVLYEPSAFEEVQRISPELLRMDFTVESADAVRAVLAGYEQYVLGRTPQTQPFDGESTRGHFKRGVE